MGEEAPEVAKKGNKGLKTALVVVSIFLLVLLVVNVYIHILHPYGIPSSIKTAVIETDLEATDHNVQNGSNYLQISGIARNVGNYITYCRLQVVLYQNQTIAKDTFIDLGTIDCQKIVEIDEKVYYEGAKLTNWTITPVYPKPV